MRKSLVEPTTRNNASLKKLNQALYQTVVENRLGLLSSSFDNEEQATLGINQITDILTEAFYAQGKTVKDDNHKQKPWWDKDKL